MQSNNQLFYTPKATFLTDKSILFGLTNYSLSALSSNGEFNFEKILDSYSQSFSTMEWNTDPQHLIEESVLHHLLNSDITSIFIRMECNANIFRENGVIFSDHWTQFITSLSEYSSVKKNMILSFDRNTHYSKELLESFLTLREEIIPIELFFECDHHSWKNPSALKIIRGGKIKVVQRDIPDLAGFNFHIANPDKKECYLRLLGRNKVNWFSTEKKIRYQYDYTKAELEQIISKINSLRMSYEKIYVIGCNSPSHSAISNVRQLSKLYQLD